MISVKDFLMASIIKIKGRSSRKLWEERPVQFL